MQKHHIQSSYKNTNNQCYFLTPFQRQLLNKSLATDLCSKYRHRIEIMLLADAGYSQAYICKALSCRPGTARYWIAIAQSGQAHQWNERRIGRPKVINEQYLHRLQELVSYGPRAYGYSFQRWTAQWLNKHLAKETGTQISDRHINRLLKTMRLSTRENKSTDISGNEHSNSKLVSKICKLL